MWIFYAFQVISDLFKCIITILFRITKLPSKLLWDNILPSKPAHYNGTTVDAVLFFKQRFLSIRWGVGSGLSRVIYRILMVRIEGIKKIQKVLKSKVLKYLIDSTKINISRILFYISLKLQLYISLGQWIIRSWSNFQEEKGRERERRILLYWWSF